MKGKSLPMLMLSVALIIVSVSTAGCTGQVTEPPVQETPTQIIEDITPQEASDIIDENRGNPDFVIIDVRTPEEFADGHIENAVNIDYHSATFESEIGNLDRDETYLIYCRSGNRSRGALNVMVELGFKEVYHISVGITGWMEDGFHITK